MKNKYYKSLPNSLAKTRISKLVEASIEAWNKHYEAEKYSKQGDVLYDHTLRKAVSLEDSLRIMGIVKYDI
jgi:ABC-type ATPase with predicted acetyltransferase domain